MSGMFHVHFLTIDISLIMTLESLKSSIDIDNTHFDINYAKNLKKESQKLPVFCH